MTWRQQPLAIVVGVLWLVQAVVAQIIPAPGGAAGGVPIGGVLMLIAGSCGAGYAEVSALAGNFPLGTSDASGDVGGTGGSHTFTPAGTVGVPIFTGSPVASSADSAGTPSGTNSAPTISWPASVPTAATESAHTHSVTAAGTNSTSSVSGTSATEAAHTHSVTSNVTATFSGNAVAAASTNPTPDLVTSNTGGSGVSPVTTATGTVNTTNNAVTSGAGSAHSHGAGSYTAAAQTFTGSAVTSAAGSAHTHTLSWPASVPTASTPTFSGTALAAHQHTLTAAGTNSAPSFAGVSADVRPAFVKVIFCRRIA